MVKQLQPARASALPASPDPVGRPGPSSALAAATAPGLLLLILVVLMLPGTFRLAGAVLSPYRVMLLVLFPFLVRRWIADTGGRLALADLLVAASCLWMVLSLVMNNGMRGFPRGAIMFVELFGGYLIGRTLVRNRTDHKDLFRLLAIVFLFLLPFVVVESLTTFNALRPIFREIGFGVPPRQHNLGMRFGLFRAQGTLDHPILLGLVASLGVANALYIYRRRLREALGRAGVFGVVVVTSVSSGPLLSVGIQLGLTAWDRGLAFLRFKWLLLAYLTLLAALMVWIGAEFRLREFIVEYLSYNEDSAEGRLIVFDYGMMEVRRHPVFGLGMNDWTRPWWRAGKSSFDNFWLGQAMRYGVPAFAFLALGWAVAFARIAMQKTLSPEEADYRQGYLITLAGLTIALGATNIYNAAAVYVMIYVGAGGWFYLQPREADAGDALVRSRRAAQARAFGVAPAAIRAPGGRQRA